MRKITLLITLVASSNSFYGMEMAQQEAVRRFVYPNDPRIVVIQDDIYNRRTKNADVTIVGETEQILLKKPGLAIIPIIGAMHFTEGNSVMVKKKVLAQHFDYSYGLNNDSAAIVVDGEQFIIQNLRSHTEQKKMDGKLLFIKEPQLLRAKVNDKKIVAGQYVYNKTLDTVAPYSSQLEVCQYVGMEAFQEAIKDLERCYEAIFEHIHQFYSREIKSIALPQLSAALGIPAYSAAYVALASAIKFIMRSPNKDKYDCIEFVVDRSEEFDIYKSILRGYARLHQGDEGQASNKKEDCS